ncbi:MAG: DUF3488 domain-containing protein [Phycisphaerales bacterium]|nr:DUF3488 domain-containing protein [Phycisphaerales bacterium]
MKTERLTPLDRVRRSYRRSLLWLTLITILLFGVADANAIFTVLALIGIFVAWNISVRHNEPVSRLVINAILVLVLSIAALSLLQSGIGVSSFALFAGMLLVVKLFDLRSVRDDRQVIVLVIALIVSAVLTSNSLFTGLVLVVDVAVLLRTVVRFHIYAVASHAGERSPIFELPKGGRVDLRSFQFATMFLVVIVGSLIFAILPRNLGTSSFGQWGSGSVGSVSGFADQIELGRPGLISQSPKPVLDLEVFDRNEKNVGSLNSPPIYLRGAVLTSYNQGRWGNEHSTRTRLPIQLERIPANKIIIPAINPNHQDWDREYRISLRGAASRESTIFLPWLPTQFVSASPIRIGYEKATGRMIHGGTGSSVSYSVRATNAKFLNVRIPEDYLRKTVDPRGITPAITLYAADIIRSAGLDPDPQTRPVDDDLAVVRVLENNLHSKYTYSLQSEPIPPGQDATEWFLFERKSGHCEYYASSLALMARSAGINARVITGYVASDYNEITGQYIVRESNAHAWIEAEVGPRKWLTFDGTLRADFQELHEPKQGFWSPVTRWYEMIEYAWVKGVVGYDSESRKRVFGDISGDLGLVEFGLKMQERIRQGRAQLLRKASLVGIAVFGFVFVLGLVLLRARPLFRALFGPIIDWLVILFARLRGSGGTEEQLNASRLERGIVRGLSHAQIQREQWRPLHATLSGQHPDIQQTSIYAALTHAAQLLYRFRFAPASSAPQSGEVSEVLAKLRASEK